MALLSNICIFAIVFLPCVLAKLFNIMIAAGKVPVKFGQSYTVPILKDNSSMYNKTVTVSGLTFVVYR